MSQWRGFSFQVRFAPLSEGFYVAQASRLCGPVPRCGEAHKRTSETLVLRLALVPHSVLVSPCRRTHVEHVIEIAPPTKTLAIDRDQSRATFAQCHRRTSAMIERKPRGESSNPGDQERHPRGSKTHPGAFAVARQESHKNLNRGVRPSGRPNPPPARPPGTWPRSGPCRRRSRLPTGRRLFSIPGSRRRPCPPLQPPRPSIG